MNIVLTMVSHTHTHMRMYVYILPSSAVHVKKATLGRTNFPNAPPRKRGSSLTPIL